MVLSTRYLAFAKHFDKEAAARNDGPLQKWQEELVETAVSLEELKELFRKHDKDQSMSVAVQAARTHTHTRTCIDISHATLNTAMMKQTNTSRGAR